MSKPGDVVAVVLAAGLSRRYGNGDKLLHPLGGRPLCLHIAATLRRLPFSRRVAVCSNPAVAQLFEAEGFAVVRNADPQIGLGSSLRIAVQAAGNASPILVCLADMPFVTPTHLLALAHAFQAGSADPVASAGPDFIGPPAIFSAGLLEHLPANGEGGARALLRGATTMEAAPRELADFDTRAALEAASAGDLDPSLQP